MNIALKIDGIEISAAPEETIADIASRMGIHIPRLCNRQSDSHRAGCMICAVFDKSRNVFIPSCEAKAAEKMDLEVKTQRVDNFRKEALGLLLAEHKGDCLAPCRKACPYGFDIPRFLEKLAANDTIGVQQMLKESPECETCKLACQIACRRKLLDSAVEISDLIKKHRPVEFKFMQKTPKEKRYTHNFGKPTKEELEAMAASSNDSNRCLQCHCKKDDACVLRRLADEFGMRQPKQIKIKSFGRVRANGVVFEKSKCVLCASCAQVGGLAIRGRAYKAVPDKPNGAQWKDSLFKIHATLCPTGAISEDKTQAKTDE